LSPLKIILLEVPTTMKSKYSEAFIEQAVVKLLSRGQRTVREVAVDLNVNYHTAKNWMKRGSPVTAAVGSTKEKRQQDWTAQEQLVALHETHGLSGDALQAWCRERGLFAHHLTSWRAAFCAAAKTDSGTRELRSLKDENDQLKRELVRKEKALAEAAALLVLQKKFRALWEDEAK
jgi:transposase-like protein